MIPKGYRKGYCPVTHERYINCNWLECNAGLGLAGRGLCSSNGYWWWKNCSYFEKSELQNNINSDNFIQIVDK